MTVLTAIRQLASRLSSFSDNACVIAEAWIVLLETKESIGQFYDEQRCTWQGGLHSHVSLKMTKP